MVHELPLGTFRPENRTTFSDVPFTFQPDFAETFSLMVNNLKITFMEDDKRQFLLGDQFFLYVSFTVHFSYTLQCTITEQRISFVLTGNFKFVTISGYNDVHVTINFFQ